MSILCNFGLLVLLYIQVCLTPIFIIIRNNFVMASECHNETNISSGILPDFSYWNLVASNAKCLPTFWQTLPIGILGATLTELVNLSY